MEADRVGFKAGDLSVECHIANYIVYKEVIATGRRDIKMPVNLSFIGFPEKLSITVSSTAVVQNGDEFVRNVDLAAEFAGYIGKKLGLSNVAESISNGWEKASSFLGW